MAYNKKKNNFEEKIAKSFKNTNNLRMESKKNSNKMRFNDHVPEISADSDESNKYYISENENKYSSEITSSRKELLNRHFEDGKFNAKYLHKNENAIKRPKNNNMTKDRSESITIESTEPEKQYGNISRVCKNTGNLGSSDMANVWMVQTCGPDICSMEQDIYSRFTDKEDLERLEQYNTTSFPFPVKNKYLEILKIYDFPFDKIGPFEESKLKAKQCNIKPPVPLVQRAIDEAHELFVKAGYEDELIQWLRRVFKIYPRPEDPHEYLKYNLAGGQDQKSNNEYIQLLEELKNLLAFENELAFELAQIKLLCGMVDEETFGIDGKSRAEWENQVRNLRKKKLESKIKCLSILYNNVNKEIKQEKKRISDEKASAKQAVRGQIMKDLPIWKKYKAPVAVKASYAEEAGRLRDWFTCLRYPDKEGKSQAPVYEFDDIEAFRKDTFDELKSRSSSLLEEDFK